MWKFLVIFIFLIPYEVSAQKADTVRSALKDTIQMKDVTLTAKSAVKISGDTISYTVDSLTKNPNATTEDVLKKIPGVEITSDGKIMVNGKEVTKLFINGKLYTSDDIRTLTQNLPAEVLEKMQLADWYDEESQFTGIKKGGSTEKMLNLKIKKQYERGAYGQAIAGAGTKNTYQAGTFTNYMSHDTRLSFLAKTNNTGLQDVGITTSGNSDNTKATTPNATGMTTRRIADLSFSHDPGKKLKINGNYNVTYTDNTQQQSSLRNTYLPGDSSLLQKQEKDIHAISNNHRLNTRSEWAIDSMHSMQTDIGLSYRQNKTDNTGNDGTYYNTTDNINFTRQSSTKNTSEGYGINIGNTLRKKFRKQKRTASFDAGINYNKDKTSGNNLNLNRYYQPVATNNNDYISVEKKNTFSSRAGINYNEPIGKFHILSIGYRNNYSLNENDRDVQSDSNGIQKVDTVQTREYDTHNTEHNVRLGYQFRNDKLRANIELAATSFNRDIRQKGLTTETQLRQGGINYQPGLFINYDFVDQTSLSIHYNINIRRPDILQLQTIPDYRDSMNISLGNPALLSETSNAVYANFNSTTKNGKRNLWVTFNSSWSYDKVISKTEINASKRITSPVNADGYYMLSANTGYYRKIAKWIGATLSASGGYTNNITITNGQLQYIPSKYYSASSKMSFTINEWYEGDLSYNFFANTFNNSSGNTNELQRHTITGTGTLTLPYKIRFIYYLNYIHNEGITASFNPDFILTNATVEKSFDKPKGLVFRVQGFDVFNNYPNVQRTFGDNYFEDRSANRLGRFFMFSLIYKFTYFPGKNKSA